MAEDILGKLINLAGAYITLYILMSLTTLRNNQNSSIPVHQRVRMRANFSLELPYE